MKVSKAALANATDEQLIALRDNVLKHWQQLHDDDIEIRTEILGAAIMVYLPDIVIGIEPDGYTHS